MASEQSCFATLWNGIKSFFAWLFCCAALEVSTENKRENFEQRCVQYVLKKVDEYGIFKDFYIVAHRHDNKFFTPIVSSYPENEEEFRKQSAKSFKLVAKERLASFLKTLTMDSPFEIYCFVLDAGSICAGRNEMIHRLDCDFNQDKIESSPDKIVARSQKQQERTAALCTGKISIEAYEDAEDED